MQLAEDGSPASDPSKSGFLSPGRAFALLFGVILLLGATIFLLRPSPAAEPRTTSDPPAPTFELTDTEAIARFEQLDLLLQRIYAERDVSLIALALTSDSPLAEIGSREVRRLLRDGVIDETYRETRDLQVVANSGDEVVIRQTVFEDPKFVDERSGEEVTRGNKQLLQTIDWTLRLEGGAWKVFELDVIETEVI